MGAARQSTEARLPGARTPVLGKRALGQSRRRHPHVDDRLTPARLDDSARGDLITTEIERISALAHQHIDLDRHYPFDLADPTRGH